MKRFKARLLLFFVLLAGFAITVNAAAAASAGDIPFISIEALKAKLGDPSVVILDVRIAGDIAASRHKVKGAVWVNPKEIEQWVHSFSKDLTYVLY
jgi:3-mercaptopyruvate sulfurtransferase SseA